MKYSKKDEIDYKNEIDKYSSIKNSKFYNSIMNNNIKHLNNDELDEFVLFMKSLSEDEILLLIYKFLDDEYTLDCNLKNETPENKTIRTIFCSDGIVDYYNITYNEEY